MFLDFIIQNPIHIIVKITGRVRSRYGRKSKPLIDVTEDGPREQEPKDPTSEENFSSLK